MKKGGKTIIGEDAGELESSRKKNSRKIIRSVIRGLPVR